MEVIEDDAADPRVVRTRQRLRTAVLAAAAERPIEQVSVSDLAKAAEINRATFYKHAGSPADLLRMVLIQDYDARHAAFVAAVQTPGSRLPDVWRQALSALAAHLDQHAAIYEANLVGGRGHALAPLMARHITMTVEWLLTARPQLLPADTPRDGLTVRATSHYMGYGALGIAAAWLQEPTPRDPDRFTATVLTLLPHWILGGEPDGAAPARPAADR